MAYICVPLESCKNWEKSGRTEFVRLCKSLLQNEKDNTPSITTNSKGKDLKRTIYEVCWHFLRNCLKVDQVVSALLEAAGLHPDVVSTIADVLTVIDTETLCTEDNKMLREKLFNLIIACQTVLPDKLIKERFDPETLGDVNIIPNKKAFHTKFIKIKTKLFYKQQKFNLLREESEGYAKLITELNQEILSDITVEYVLEIIKSLIGCFNLDPNRVLDIILESFEYRPELYDFFIPLLRAYMCDQNTLCEVLGFKFDRESSEGKTSKSLYRVTALMLQHDLIPMDAIYCQLKPKDPDIYERHKKDLAEAQTYARKLNMVTTDKTAESKEEEKASLAERFTSNQKLGLCEALLTIGDWNHAEMIIKRLPDHYAVGFPPICKALCNLVHYIMDPLYRKYSGLSKLTKNRPLANFPSPLAPKPAETFVELKKYFFPTLCAVGPQLHTNPLLLVKVIRLAKAYHLQKGPQIPTMANLAETLEFDFLQALDEVVLPSLSLLECNCCIAEELWGLLRLYPYQQRYYLYGQWKNESYQNHPLLIRTRADAIRKIRYTMKRLSKENIKPSGRNIGKISHSNPGFLFDYILSQIQTWNNLIVPVVDSLKYLTNLSYDVLAYCIIEALANPDKQRMKHDGTSISLWLQSLSNFCGAVFKKYSIDLTGLLQYVANQLKAEKSLDLLIMKEIVQKMAGIEALEEMTSDQLDAMAGGELLRAEGGYFSLIRNTKKSSQRLKDALLEQELAIPLCLMMAQQRNCIIYKEQESGHVKLVGKLYDQCQDTLVQFGSFLATSLSMDDYVSRLPSIEALMSEYHIMSDVAFFLSRPMFAHSIASKVDELRKQDRSGKTTTIRPQKYVEVVESVMNPVVEGVKPLYPPKVWEDISPQFFVTFWSLTMYDLHVPATSYEKEVNKLKTQITQVEDNKDMVQSKKRKEVERCKQLIEKLVEEQKKQREHCERVLARLKSEKDTWFLSRSAKNETITQFLQLCVFPRCIFTATDAVYCAKFVHTIHILKTPNFSTLICYDRIFCDITYTVTSCTENEANRYGRFLCAMLETVMRWHSNKDIFEKECANYPGFVTKFRVANQPTENASDHVDYENYRHVCHKWHYKITKALVTCLSSGDFVQIRNSVIILIKVMPHYPIVSNLAAVIEHRIKNVRDAEKLTRPDLFALAQGYLGLLKAKKNSSVPEHEFHLKETKDATKNQSSSLKQEVVVVGAPPTNAKTNPSTSNQGVTKEALPGTTNGNKTDKAKDVYARESSSKKEDRRLANIMKLEIKNETRTVSNLSAKNTSSTKGGTNSQSHQGYIKREVSNSNLRPESDYERIVISSYDKSSERLRSGDEKERSTFGSSREDRVNVKEEKLSKEERSRYEKSTSYREMRDDGKEKFYSKEKEEDRRYSKEDLQDSRLERSPSVSSNNSNASHGQRRSVEPTDVDRDVKRRKVDHPVRSGKSPRREEKMRDPDKEKTKEKNREKSRSRESSEHESKQKEKKLERKRDRLEDPGLGEVKRRKDEASGKISSRQNGETEREKDHHRKEGRGEQSRERKGNAKVVELEEMPAPRRGRSETSFASSKKSRKN